MGDQPSVCQAFASMLDLLPLDILHQPHFDKQKLILTFPGRRQSSSSNANIPFFGYKQNKKDTYTHL